MSLNGLDDAKVAEAHQSALSEGGGWFLLKYSSRDAVEILTRGSGGLTECRSAVAACPENSPLYGFLLYRRRKVLIKYIPEGTTRLLKARVAVHFQAITDRFSPHDTIFTISSPEDLNDATLTAACALHTASPTLAGASPRTASRKKKLDEITEDAEEAEEEGREFSTPSPAPDTSSLSPVPIIKEPENSEVPPQDIMQTPVDDVPPQAPARTSMDSRPPTAMSMVSTAESEAPTETPQVEAADAEPRLSYDDKYFKEATERLINRSQTPEVNPYMDMYAQLSKPKVKLGPRPVSRSALDSERRPKTAGSGSWNSQKPVSSLPSGLRLKSRKAKSEGPPKIIEPSPSTPASALAPPVPAIPVPEIPSFPPARKSSYAASVKSLPATIHKSSGMTLEKKRLMKALEIRKKQMKEREMEKERKNEMEDAPPTPKAGIPPAENLSPVNVVDNVDINAVESTPRTTLNYGSNGTEVAQATVNSEGLTQDEGLDSTSESNKRNTIINLQNATQRSSDVKASHETTSGASSIQPTEAESPAYGDGLMHDPTNEVLGPLIGGKDVGDVIKQSKNVHQDDVTEAQRGVHSAAPETSPNQEVEAQANSNLQLPSESSKADSGVDVQIGEKSETEDSASTEMASSPTSLQDSTDRSTRPSSISEDEDTEKDGIDLGAPQIAETVIDNADPQESTAGSDELSGESSPTVVPEKRSPAPSVQVDTPMQSQDTTFESKDEQGRAEKSLSVVTVTQTVAPQGSRPNSTSREKRRALVDPILINHSADNSDVDSLSDDSLMEELQSATLQEAKPVCVSKSPITPFFSRRPSTSSNSILVRSISNPAEVQRNMTPFSGSQGPSTPTTPLTPERVVKKVNVSSGISQRIKALTEKSNRESSYRTAPPPTSSSSPESKAKRRFSRQSVASIHGNSPEPEPQQTSNPIIQPPSNAQAMYSVSRDGSRPESVSVTARIIRDERTKNPLLTAPTETTPLELHQSPIEINHQRSKLSISALRGSAAIKSPGMAMPMSPPIESQSVQQPRSSIESGWRSLGRRKSDAKSPSFSMKSPSVSSFHESDIGDDERDEKKKSRTSRILKRMSSPFSSRKGTSQSLAEALKEEDSEQNEHTLPAVREPPASVQVGDLNVQFPDTLLWKRRWVEIDSQGFMVLTQSKANDHIRGITKRYHLTEFRSPYIPDQDREELPYSILFDFLDGRTLQCACEDALSQARLLQTFQGAYGAWKAFQQ